MRRFADFYHDGKIKHDKGFYYYKDKDNYLFSYGIYKTKVREEDLPDYYVKLWLYPRYKYISLKGIKDLYYRPSFFTNHYRKDDFLYISYSDEIKFDNQGFAVNYDEVIYGPEIDHFIMKLTIYGYDKKRLDEINRLIDKKNKWFDYWDKRGWDGNYSFTSQEIWKEILGVEK